MAGPVLLVHDDIAVVAAAKRVLSRNGIETLLVTNVADAVIMFGDLAPEVVVLSAGVDGGRGAAAYGEIRAHPAGHGVRFVVLGEPLAEAPEARTVALPLDGERLVEAVRAALDEPATTGGWQTDVDATAPQKRPRELGPSGAKDASEEPTVIGPPPVAPEDWRAAPPPAVEPGPAADSGEDSPDLASELFDDVSEATEAPPPLDAPQSEGVSPLAGTPWFSLDAEPALSGDFGEAHTALFGAEPELPDEIAREVDLGPKPARPAVRDLDAELARLDPKTGRPTPSASGAVPQDSAEPGAEPTADEAPLAAAEDVTAIGTSAAAEPETSDAAAEIGEAPESAQELEPEASVAAVAEPAPEPEPPVAAAEPQIEVEAQPESEAEAAAEEPAGADAFPLGPNEIGPESAPPAPDAAPASPQQSPFQDQATARSSTAVGTMLAERARLVGEAAEARRSAEEARRAEDEAERRADEARRTAEEQKSLQGAEEVAARAAVERAHDEELAARGAEEEARRAVQELSRRRSEREVARRTEAERHRAEEDEIQRRAEAEARSLAEREARLKVEEAMRRRLEASRGRAVEEPAPQVDDAEWDDIAPSPPRPRAPSGRAKRGGSPRTEARSAADVEDAMAQAFPAAGETPPEPTLPPFAGQGTLAEIDAARFVAETWRGRVTGRFDFECDEGRRSLWFEFGRLVGVASDVPFERLEEVARREGLVTKSQHRVLRAAGIDSPRRLALRMVDMGFLKPSELYAVVKRRAEEIVFALFADEEAAYQYLPQPGTLTERLVLPAHPLVLMMDGIRRKYPANRLHDLLGGPGTVLKPAPGGPEVTDFGLAAREKRVAERVDGLHTLEEILFEGGVDELETMKVLYGLLAAGAAEVAVLGIPADAAGKAAEGRLDVERVAAKYEQVLSGDYFEILGLRRSATGYEVNEAYERLTREYNANRFAGAQDQAVATRLGEIHRALAEAVDVLSDDLIRAEYARNLLD